MNIGDLVKFKFDFYDERTDILLYTKVLEGFICDINNNFYYIIDRSGNRYVITEQDIIK